MQIIVCEFRMRRNGSRATASPPQAFAHSGLAAESTEAKSRMFSFENDAHTANSSQHTHSHTSPNCAARLTCHNFAAGAFILCLQNVFHFFRACVFPVFEFCACVRVANKPIIRDASSAPLCGGTLLERQHALRFAAGTHTHTHTRCNDKCHHRWTHASKRPADTCPTGRLPMVPTVVARPRRCVRPA